MSNDQKKLEEGVQEFTNFHTLNGQQQVDALCFVLTTRLGLTAFKPADIHTAMQSLSIKPYARTAAYLSEQARKRGGKYVKKNSGSGYALERSALTAIQSQLPTAPALRVSVDQQLKNLVATVTDDAQRRFLEEALACFQVEAYRASMVMIWIASMHHLQTYIFNNKLTDFNSALMSNPARKRNRIINYDDFSDLEESKIIEVARSASIISKDVRKILDQKLGTRNSAAHPSNVSFSSHKTTEFANDLIANVILKYR